MENWLILPAKITEPARERAEKARLRRARYEQTRPDRMKRKSTKPRHLTGLDKPFIIWDGEGPRDTGYSLFGNSLGLELCHPRLGTEECFRLIIETEELCPDGIHVWFGGNYDASNIFADMSWRHLSALHKYGKTIWRDYEVEHIPHKWMCIKRGKVTARIFDCRTFFMGGLVQVLEEWEIGPWANVNSTRGVNGVSTVIPPLARVQSMDERELVETFKSLRGEFTWADIEQIKIYMRLELKYTKILMEKLRQTFYDAGYLPSSWHGPGALARMALRRHKVYDAMADTPTDVRLAAIRGFAGGRFEDVLAGLIKDTVYVADKNSAYPYYATQLPNLSRGNWRRGRTYEPGKFAIYHIRYESKPNPYRIYPLFKRESNGNVVWPHRTEGWYWSPEAALVADDPEAEFIESWVFDEDDENDRPFAFLWEYYRRRQLLKRTGNVAEYTFKLIINAIYGQLAQRTGWDRKNRSAPNSHQLEWAGYITSGCRAEIYRIARSCGDKLISIDTDGVSSLCPFSGLDLGNNLGQWKVSEYRGGIFWQSGIYCLRTENGWEKAKTRGIPRGSYSAEEMIECMEKSEPLRISKKVFVTYGMADARNSRETVNTWQMEPHEFVFGGTGKRMHFSRACEHVCISGQIHRLGMLPMLYGPHSDAESRPHYLPWLDSADAALARTKQLMIDLEWFDQNHLDPDEEWVRTLQ